MSSRSAATDRPTDQYRTWYGSFYTRYVNSGKHEVSLESKPEHYEYEDPPEVKVSIYVDGPECEEVESDGNGDGDKENASTHKFQEEPNSWRSPTASK